MPITGVLDLQRRSLPLGEIRIGESEEIPGKKYRRPVRRETFRFTTPVEETAAAIAARLGGTPAPWDRREGYWVVDTSVSSLDVWVPPRGLAVDAWMELWDGGKCRRRCDGIIETRSGQPCMCPQPEDRSDPAQVARAAAERKRLATEGKACKPLTRINLAIPWLPGAIGVWRLNTGSANAAVETADTGEILERARDMDVYLPAVALIHWRPGQDGHPYPVPVLRPRPSAEQVAQLPAGMDGMLAQLGDGASGGPLALAAGKTGHTGKAGEPPPTKAPGPERAAQQPLGEVTAQQIADLVPLAKTRDDLEKLIHRAKGAEGGSLLDQVVCDPGEPEVHEELQSLIDARWRELPARPRHRAQQAATAGDGGLWPAEPPPGEDHS